MTIRTSYHGRLMRVVRMMAFLSFPAALLTAAPALTIQSSGSAAPGQILPVTVTPSGGSFTQVVLVGEGPIGYSGIITTGPPYYFSLPIPATISPGAYSLTALGLSSTGSLSTAAMTISVERPDAPIQIDVTPTTLNLPVGERVPLRVIGIYLDGTQLDITHSANTTFSSTLPGIAKVDGQGYVTALETPPVVYGVVQQAHILVNNSLSIPVFTPAALAVTPQWPLLYASQRTQFSAFQPGMAAVPVKWSINPQLGTIDNAGLYTAPNRITPGGQGVTITATMRDNPAISVSTGVSLCPPVTVTIVAEGPLMLMSGQTVRLAQTVVNTLDERVNWSISPKNLGAIDNTGLYTAPASITTQQTVVVTATSVADSSKTASLTVTLVP